MARNIEQNFQKEIEQTGTLQNHKIITAYKRRKNLGDYLVQARVPPQIKDIKKEKERFLNHLKWVESENGEEIFKINTITNWNKKNCVYLITCEKCNKKYVGETRNTLAERFYQHKYNISKEQNSQTTIVKHFIEQVMTTGLAAKEGERKNGGSSGWAL